ncbi:MAG: deoxyribose-phosphate aldolase [Ruminococcaceae bacterium]|nr:deoxyribose-phosphate aldolase [Oscillospiraceae bacterium]
MEIKDILSKVDHTVLSTVATWDDIKACLDDGIKYSCASCCIPASYIREAKEYVGDRIPLCTVIGFPNGYTTTRAKAFEAADAVLNGACEIDMVINIGWLKDKRYDLILNEINEIKKACDGRLLKVIIETCVLTDEEIVRMAEIVSRSDADFIKTSTGFSSGGATMRDMELFVPNLSGETKIKAAGGISSLEDAERFLESGASRLGTSRIVKIVKSMEKGEKNDTKDSSY